MKVIFLIDSEKGIKEVVGITQGPHMCNKYTKELQEMIHSVESTKSGNYWEIAIEDYKCQKLDIPKIKKLLENTFEKELEN